MKKKDDELFQYQMVEYAEFEDGKVETWDSLNIL